MVLTFPSRMHDAWGPLIAIPCVHSYNHFILSTVPSYSVSHSVCVWGGGGGGGGFIRRVCKH